MDGEGYTSPLYPLFKYASIYYDALVLNIIENPTHKRCWYDREHAKEDRRTIKKESKPSSSTVCYATFRSLRIGTRLA